MGNKDTYNNDIQFFNTLQTSELRSKFGAIVREVRSNSVKVSEEERTRFMNVLASTLGLEHGTQLSKDKLDYLFSDNEAPSDLYFKDYYDILNDLCNRIEANLGHFGKSMPKRPVFGPLPTGTINAISIRNPNGSYVVALNSGLFTFLNSIAKVLTEFIECGEEGSLSFAKCPAQDTIRANPPAVLQAFEIVAAALVFEVPALVNPYYLVNRTRFFLGNAIRDGAELFVLAHEYAHCFLGHVDLLNTRAMLLSGQLPAHEINFQHRQEFEADMWGMAVSSRCMNVDGYDAALSYAGTDVFLTINSLFEELGYTTRTATHPPTGKRRDFLRGYLLTECQPREQGGAAYNMATRLEALMEALLGEFKSSLDILKNSYELQIVLYLYMIDRINNKYKDYDFIKYLRQHLPVYHKYDGTARPHTPGFPPGTALDHGTTPRRPRPLPGEPLRPGRSTRGNSRSSQRALARRQSAGPGRPERCGYRPRPTTRHGGRGLRETA